MMRSRGWPAWVARTAWPEGSRGLLLVLLVLTLGRVMWTGIRKQPADASIPSCRISLLEARRDGAVLSSVDDLLALPGFGPATVDGLREHVR